MYLGITGYNHESSAALVDDNGVLIGSVTSGGFSPSLEKPIAMAYINSDFAILNTNVNAMVRGKFRLMQIVKMPFIPTRYCR